MKEITQAIAGKKSCSFEINKLPRFGTYFYELDLPIFSSKFDLNQIKLFQYYLSFKVRIFSRSALVLKSNLTYLPLYGPENTPIGGVFIC